MDVTVRDFLGSCYNHGDYITVVNNKGLNEVLWEGKYETVSNHINWTIYDLKVVKWGIENNSIVIYVNYNKKD